MAVFAGTPFDRAQAAAWEGVRGAFARFDAADRYLFSLPMWNAGVPYILKQFIDVVSQPGLVFAFDPERGYTGLLRGKKAAVIYTSAVYGRGRGPAFGSDFQTTYFNDWLRWAGVSDIEEVEFRPNLATTDPELGRRAARARAAEVAKSF
jgi:FMN-dependent NADH-azoreductase